MSNEGSFQIKAELKIGHDDRVFISSLPVRMNPPIFIGSAYEKTGQVKSRIQSTKRGQVQGIEIDYDEARVAQTGDGDDVDADHRRVIRVVEELGHFERESHASVLARRGEEENDGRRGVADEDGKGSAIEERDDNANAPDALLDPALFSQGPDVLYRLQP